MNTRGGGPPEVAPVKKSGLQYPCKICNRSYRSAQGLRTHTHMVHELGVVRTNPAGLKCPHCSKMLPNEDALAQHTAGKHTGLHLDIKPDWYGQKSIYVEKEEKEQVAFAADQAGRGDSDGQVKAISDQPHLICTICKFYFASEDHLLTHLENLKPVDDYSLELLKEKYHCRTCSKSFVSIRSLKQHETMCALVKPDSKATMS